MSGDRNALRSRVNGIAWANVRHQRGVSGTVQVSKAASSRTS